MGLEKVVPLALFFLNIYHPTVMMGLRAGSREAAQAVVMDEG